MIENKHALEFEDKFQSNWIEFLSVSNSSNRTASKALLTDS
jgi:hypothetical protein